MESSFSRVFDIPELALHVEKFLLPQDLACLTITSRAMHKIFGPRYNFLAREFKALRLLRGKVRSPHKLTDLARNAWFTRTIMLDGACCHVYYTALKDFYSDPDSPTTATTTTTTTATATTTTTAATASSLTATPSDPQPSLDPSSPDQTRPSLEDLCSRKVLPARARHFLRASPHLTTLHIENIHIPCHVYAIHWGLTVSGITTLETLYLGFTTDGGSTADEIIPTVFSYCPPSLKSMSLGIHDIVSTGMWNHLSDPARDPEVIQLSVKALNGVQRIHKREDKLSHLTEMKAFNAFSWNYKAFGNMLIYCPYLVSMEVPQSRFDLPLSVKKLYADFIVRACPKLRNLSQTFPLTRQDPELLYALIDSMQENTLESLDLTAFRDTDIRIAKSLGRHFASIRHFEIQNCCGLHIESIQSVLFSCSGLEVFKVLDTPVRLVDLIEKRWASTRIQELLVIIDAGETYVPIRPDNWRHFNSQHKEKVAQLEALYRQLGALTELKVIDLRPLSEDLVPHYFGIDQQTTVKFALPGLLTVGDEGGDGGRWGGLQFMSGLKKLTTLRGLFAADASTMPGLILGEKDVEWAAGNWPSLERIEFFLEDHGADSSEISSSMTWLQTKLPQVKFTRIAYLLRD